MKKQFFVSTLVLGCLGASALWAQSCKPIEMTDEQIQKTDMIVIAEAYDPDAKKNPYQAQQPFQQKPPQATVAKEGDEDTSDGRMKKFHLKVIRTWKGAEKGDEIEVWRDVTWGDGYEPGEQYFIGAMKKEKEAPLQPSANLNANADANAAAAQAQPEPKAEYEVPLCGLSFHYPTYEQRKKHYNFFGEKQYKAVKTFFDQT